MERGLSISDKRITNLRYANTLIAASNEKECLTIMDKLVLASEENGLLRDINKIKVMAGFEVVEEHSCMGSLITKQGGL